ncbi:hypothetical protein [Rhodopseudomonas sp. BR0G17]|uniref:hypothetical protein n=1 Tax=Rhodopseudomonas sp. BR0G17 TaxID=2269368 RepID=UPI00196823CA|nr:hypothetical protein [Rhodopseudomonas sp. BR0G17]NEW96664.1 hypothetical protein [Rhodopseudomonas sp. BR0G17]
MGTKSREVIYGSRLRGLVMDAASAREEAIAAVRRGDRAEAEAWSLRMEGFGGPAQPSPTLGQCLNGGLAWLEVECMRCKTRAGLSLVYIRRPRDTPTWKLEASLRCRACATPRRRAPARIIKLTAEREIPQRPWDGADPDEV